MRRLPPTAAATAPGSSTTRRPRRPPGSCRPQRLARKKAAAVAGPAPERFREVSFDREPVPRSPRRAPARRARRPPLRDAPCPSSSRGPRPCGSPATSGPARRRSAMLDLQGRDGGRPHGRDLLAAAPARACSRLLPRRRGVLAQRPDRAAVRGRPAARRRRRRRADEPMGARAALHDRQHALRGRRARCSTTNLDTTTSSRTRSATARSRA